MERQDIRGAEAALIDLNEISVDKEDMVKYAAILARLGRRPAADMILQYIRSDVVFPTLTGDCVSSAINSLSAFYIVTGQARTLKSQMTDIADYVLQSEPFQSYTDEDKAVIANATQKLFFDIDDYDTSKKYSELAVNFEPSEPIWIYNLAMICHFLADHLRAANLYTRYLSLMREQAKSIRSENLAFGVRVFAQVGQDKQMLELLQSLAVVDPRKAAELEHQFVTNRT